jgi:hypothetical protein
VAAGDMMTESAIALLADRLRTPLQIEQHLTLAFEEGCRIGEKPVTMDAVEAVLSRQLDDLEPKLTRHGTVKLAESRLGRSQVSRVDEWDDDASRPDLCRPSLPG